MTRPHPRLLAAPAAVFLALLVPATVVAISPDWTRHVGTKAEDAAGGIAADGSGLTIVGTTGGNLTHRSRAGATRSSAATTARARSSGLGSSAPAPRSSAKTSRPTSGGLTVLGSTDGSFSGPGGTLGIDDVFVRRYDRDGHVKWTRQFGTSVDEDPGRSPPATAGCSSSG